MPLPYLLPHGPAAFITLATCPRLPTHQPPMARPQPGAGSFRCPHPCAVADTPACHFQPLHATPPPPHQPHVVASLRLRQTLRSLRPGPPPVPGGGQPLSGAAEGVPRTRPLPVALGPLLSLSAGTLPCRLGLN